MRRPLHCPRCRGRLLLERDITGWQFTCLLCARSWHDRSWHTLGYRSRLGPAKKQASA